MSPLLGDNDFNEIEGFEHGMENAEQVDEGESMDTPVDEAKVLDPPNNESTQAASNHTTRNPVSEPSGSKPTLVNKNLNRITHNLAPERTYSKFTPVNENKLFGETKAPPAKRRKTVAVHRYISRTCLLRTRRGSREKSSKTYCLREELSRR